MAVIGEFTKTEDGFSGTIRTLGFTSRARILPVNKTNDKAPAWRVYAGAVEIGAGWDQTPRGGGSAYVSLSIDAPSFDAPIRARLVAAEHKGKDDYELVWSRQTKRH
jgi:uncharacterized protein (DUF736 family)